MILITKDNTYTQGIGILEVLWKVIEAIFDTRINKAVTFHNILHRFREGRLTGTPVMDLKIAQELASMDQEPLFLLFLELQKAYDNLYGGCLLHILERNRAGQKMRDILEEFWARQEVVTQQNSCHGPQFRANHRNTQGGLTLTKLFNMAFESVVQHWLYMTVEDDAVIQNGLGHVVG